MEQGAEFDNLESFYSHIDAHALEYKYLMEIGDQSQKLRDLLHEKGDETGAQIAQYEVDAFNLQTKGHELGPVMMGTDGNGNEVHIPDITKFTDEEIDYFSKRLENVSNPRLKARYAHILWNSPQKRRQHAEDAEEAYVQLIAHFEAKDKAGNTDQGLTGPHYGQDVIESVKCAFGIAANARVGIDALIPVVVRLVEEFNPQSSSWYRLNYELLELLIDNRTHLTADIQNRIPSLCLDRSDQIRKRGNLHGSIEINKLGLRADQLLSSKTANWNRRIAECYEQLMETSEKSPMVAAEWCQRAMDYYKAAGESPKAEELAQKRKKYGTEMEFQEVSTEIDQTAHIAWCEKMGKELATHATDEILAAILVDPHLLPLKSDMELQAKESAKGTPLLSLISETVMDDRMHVVEHVSTPEEKLKRGTLEAFKFHLKLEKVPLINAIMYHAFRAGKIDSNKVISSLKEKSWIGNTLKSQRGSNREYTYCWLDQLRPSIDEYFSYLAKMLEGHEPDEPPITAIDSLTLKFEGLVRDFAQLNGILTHIDAKDKAGRTVTREKDLSQLLFDPRIAGLFTADDLLFFRFLFVEHSGFTFRHRVAHGLMLIEDYNFGILQLIFVAVMRLAKYPIKSDLDDTEEPPSNTAP